MGSFLAGLAVGAVAGAAAAALVFRRRLGRIGRFFSFAAHELNTPVTAVNMTVINLLSGVFGEVPEGQVRWIRLMSEQINRLNGLVGELRDFIHIQLSKELLLAVEETPVPELVRDALSAVRQGLLQAEIEVAVGLDDPLPALHVDRDRAVRTLTSMIFHARKFRSAGGMRIEARRQGEDRVVLLLSYQGAALPPGEAERSLEVFYPADQRKDLLLGATGLGLGVLREIARRLGGELEFRAEPDGHSLLSLVLPARRMVQSGAHGH